MVMESRTPTVPGLGQLPSEASVILGRLEPIPPHTMPDSLESKRESPHFNYMNSWL